MEAFQYVPASSISSAVASNAGQTNGALSTASQPAKFIAGRHHAGRSDEAECGAARLHWWTSIRFH